MSENEAATKDDSGSQKRRKRSKGSQTCKECCGSCHNMADLIAEIKEKLDKALNCIIIRN